MLCKDTHCTEWIVDNTRPHQLHWDDWEMGTATSCTKCSQVAGLMHMTCTPLQTVIPQTSLSHFLNPQQVCRMRYWNWSPWFGDAQTLMGWICSVLVPACMGIMSRIYMHKYFNDDFSPVDIHPLPPVWISLQSACSVHQMPALLVETVPQGRLIAEGGHIHQKCYGSVLEDDMGYYYTANALGLQYQW